LNAWEWGLGCDKNREGDFSECPITPIARPMINMADGNPWVGVRTGARHADRR